MDIRLIKSDKDHATALDEMKGLWNAAEDTPEYDRLAVMITLVHDYKERRWPIGKNLDTVQAIEVDMEAEGHTPPISPRLSARAAQLESCGANAR